MKEGVCFDKELLSQIEKESQKVCQFTDCLAAAAELLKSLGYRVRVEGDLLSVEEYQVVESVKFRGFSGLEEVEKVVKFLLLGKPISRTNLDSVKQLVLLKLKSLGFPQAKVSIRLLRGKCGYTAVVSVERGVPLVVVSLKVNAPKPFRAKVLKLFSSLLGKKLNYQSILNLRERVEDFLIKKGYYNCNVLFQVVPLNREGKVELRIRVNPGKRYRVVFQGNRHFSTDRLMSLVTFPSARSVDEFEIENSKKRIEKFYRDHGFPFVKVSSVTVDRGSEVLIEFKVEEGPYVVVRKIVFEGFRPKETYFSSLLGKPFSEEEVNREINRVVSKLKSSGYREADGSYRVELPSTLVVSLKRGPLFEVVSVKVLGDVAGCYRGVSVPFPYTEAEVEKLTSRISDCYASKGYPDARISVKTRLLRESQRRVNVELNLVVTSGNYYRFGYVVVRGLRRTRLSAVENLILISPGEAYSRKKVVKQYSRLLDSKLFSTININEVRFDSTVSEVINLQEGSLLRLKGFLGYGTDYGAVTNGFLSMTSPFSMGLKFFLFGRYRQKEGYDAVFKVLKPAFPFKNWNSGYSIVKKQQIYQSFKSNRVIYSLSLERKKTRSFSQTFKFEVSRENVYDTSIQSVKNTLERRLVYLQLYDRRDSISDPKNGYLSYTRTSVAGLLLGGDTDYTLLEEELLYLKTFKGITAAVRLGGGVISSIRGSTVPLQDRFFLGGAESVRGYKYGTISPTDSRGNYVGGKAYGLFSVELRHRIYGQIEGALFYDAGKVFREPSQFSLSNWYSSVGVGLRYLTPVGPLRIDYGYKLRPVPGQGRGRFHISFGFPF